jgi:Zn-dependent protease with chaperone function
MDFFERQDKARRKTRTLVIYFIAAVVCIVAAVYLIVAVALGLQGMGGVWQPELLLWVSLGTIGVVAAGSLFKISQLSQGGSVVASMLGGRLVNPNSSDTDERKLLNVIEEMSIASGVPVPEIYVLDEEEGINAFASGYAPDNAAVGVTRGAMRLLNRDELQGVIAHEFSHILNGDMRINIRLIGILSGILFLAVIGRILLYSGGRSSRSRGRSQGGGGGAALLFIGIGLLLVGSIGVLFGRLIKSAISRQREFLADAAAVQFTRNPDGLAGALKKIGGLAQGSRLHNPNAEEASHLFFGNGMRESFMGLLSTHPPLEQRIRALDPAFDGQFPEVSLPDRSRTPPAAAEPQRRRPPIPVPVITALAGSGSAGSPRRSPPGAGAPPVIDSIGNPTIDHLNYAASLVDRLPEPLRAAAHEPFGACALVYCILLSPDPVTRKAQIQQLSARAHPEVFVEVQRLLPHRLGMDTALNLPLVDLALPALRHLAPEQYERFKGNVRHIIASDQRIDLFEFMLERLILRHLEPHYTTVPRTVVQYHSIQHLLPDCERLLSALSHLGHSEPAGALKAFRAGAAALESDSGTLRLRPLAECGLADIERALDKLALASLPLKKRVIDAMSRTVLADGKVQPREAELLRAIADSLACPMPPLIA